MGMSLLAMLAGLVLLYFGAEGLVRGSSSLALRLGISPLVIGLTVVAYGTSMPELVVSIKAVLLGQGAISIGNVVGSNIFNIAVILGIAALIYPMKVQRQLVRLDTPVMILVSFLFLFFFRDLAVSRIEGGILFIGVLTYTIGNLYLARRESAKKAQEKLNEASPKHSGNLGADLLFIAAGFGLLILGANFLVEGAVTFARLLGISEAVIGLTIVAAGTSLPELATSVVAALKKESDIAIGNIVGSNIFNILCILGTASLIRPITGTGISMIDVYVMLVAAVALLPILKTDFLLDRKEGCALLIGYIAYLYYLLHG